MSVTGIHAGTGCRPPRLVQRDEDDDAVPGPLELRGLGVARVDVHRDVQAGAAGVDHERPALDDLADRGSAG